MDYVGLITNAKPTLVIERDLLATRVKTFPKPPEGPMAEYLFENPFVVGFVGALLTGLSLFGWIQTGNKLAAYLDWRFW